MSFTCCSVCKKQQNNTFDSFEREEHHLRLTATLGPRSLPRRCSGLPKSWWRHSDRVRLMLHFSISAVTCGSWSSLPAEAWPLWRRPLPRSVMESDIWMHFCPLEGNYLSIISIHQHNSWMRNWLECTQRQGTNNCEWCDTSEQYFVLKPHCMCIKATIKVKTPLCFLCLFPIHMDDIRWR